MDAAVGIKINEILCGLALSYLIDFSHHRIMREEDRLVHS